MALASNALVTVAELEAWLGLSGTGTALEPVINIASAQWEALTEGPGIQASAAERYAATPAEQPYPYTVFRETEFDEGSYRGMAHTSGGAKLIWLRRYPLVSVTSIVDEGTSVQTIASTDYILLRDIGALQHYSAWPTAYKADGSGNDLVGEWVITYTAGYWASVSAVPWDVKGIVLKWAGELRSRATSGGAIEVDSGDLRVKYGGYSSGRAGAAGALDEAERSVIGAYTRGRVK